MSPVTLAIDTARDRLQLALLDGAGAVVSQTISMATGHAEAIMPAIAALLAGAETDFPALDRIAVTTGPGSFTGLRVGLSAARGLGLALSIPVIGVPTLFALSLTREGPSEIIIDARRNQGWRQSFLAPGQPIGPVELVDLNQALQTASRTASDVPHIDIEALARFAAKADPESFPPDPTYAREADAKPQTRGKVAHK